MEGSLMLRAVPLALVAVLALAGSAQAAKAKTTLTASVGPGFTISLKKGAAKATTLKPGAYVIKVSDKSNFHNFRVRGPGGVNKATTVAFMGNKTFNVTLRAGTYRYQCDPHSGQMRGSFRVRS
jgi:plastocyanin